MLVSEDPSPTEKTEVLIGLSNFGKEVSTSLGDKNDEIIDNNLDKGFKFTKFVGSLYNYDDRSKFFLLTFDSY